MKVMSVKTLCLAILHNGPMSGYEIRKLVAEGTLAHFTEASFGSIYPALEKLEGEGAVTSHEERDPGKPPRRVFAITEGGRRAFREALRAMPGEDVFSSPFLLVAASAPLVEPAHMRRVLDARLAWYRKELARMEAERVESVGKCDGIEGWIWALDYGIEIYRTSIRWLEDNRARLESFAGAELAPPSNSAAVAAE